MNEEQLRAQFETVMSHKVYGDFDRDYLGAYTVLGLQLVWIGFKACAEIKDAEHICSLCRGELDV